MKANSLVYGILGVFLIAPWAIAAQPEIRLPTQQNRVTKGGATTVSHGAPLIATAPVDLWAPYLEPIQRGLPSGWVMRLPSQISADGTSDRRPYTVRIFTFDAPAGLTVSLFRCTTGEPVCLVGSFTVESKTALEPDQALRQQQTQGKAITLVPGIQGYLVDGTQYDPPLPTSTIMWEQDGLIYTASYPTAQRQDLLTAAQSMAQSLPIAAAVPVATNPVPAITPAAVPEQQAPAPNSPNPANHIVPTVSLASAAPSLTVLPAERPVAPAPPLPNRPIALQSSAALLEDAPPDDGLDQVTAIAQLADVKPTDWAFQALQSLVERYGCIAGYPDKTFRGNRALNRYEFAAGLNACLDRVNQLIAAGTADLVKRDDLLSLQKLQEEFAAELATLNGQLGTLEARAATLEKQQFSTTAILGGQIVLTLATASGGNPPGLGETNTVLTELTQLQLVSSFTGKDVLRIGLATGNFANEGFANARSLNTFMALLASQDDVNNQLQINSLEYRFALSDRFVAVVQPVGFSLNSVLSANSDYVDAGQGAISRFAALDPIFRIGSLDAGVGFDWLISDKWRLQVAYGVRNGNFPFSGLGIFGADHSALGVQFLYKPSPSFITGLTYINAYSRNGRLDTFTGSNNADISGGFNEPATIHALGLTFRWRLSPQVTLGAWGGAFLTDNTFGDVFRAITDSSINLDDLGAVTISSTYLVSLGIADPFGRKGDLFAVMVGQPPKLNAGGLIERVDDGTSIHIESFYRFRLNDHISITPGFFYVTDPGHISRNNDIFIGVIRTTFSF